MNVLIVYQQQLYNLTFFAFTEIYYLRMFGYMYIYYTCDSHYSIICFPLHYWLVWFHHLRLTLCNSYMQRIRYRRKTKCLNFIAFLLFYFIVYSQSIFTANSYHNITCFLNANKHKVIFIHCFIAIIITKFYCLFDFFQ